MPPQGPSGEDDYLAREARARMEIDKQLAAAGWMVQSQETLNLSAGPGVAVREFTLGEAARAGGLPPLPERPARRGDRGQAGGDDRSSRWSTSPASTSRVSLTGCSLPVYPLPFIYESTGAETRFTNGYDPDARSRRVFTFHRPETLAEWSAADRREPGPADLPRPAEGDAAAGRARAVGQAGRGDPQPGAVPGRGPPPVADPDGDRLGEDVHRRERSATG